MLHEKKNKDGSTGYNEPIYIAIRSEKHDKSSAVSHIEDIWALVSLDEFKEACLKDDIPKPLLFIYDDDGPDEAPKSTMALEAWAEIFQEFYLDIALIFTLSHKMN